jgi:hypothetical protein
VCRRLTLFKQFFAAGAKLALPSSVLSSAAGSTADSASPSPAVVAASAPPAEVTRGSFYARCELRPWQPLAFNQLAPFSLFLQDAAAPPTAAAISSVPVVPGVATMPPTTRARGANSVLPVPPGLTGAPVAPEIEAERGKHAVTVAVMSLIALALCSCRFWLATVLTGCPPRPSPCRAAAIAKRGKELRDREGYLRNMWYAAGEPVRGKAADDAAGLQPRPRGPCACCHVALWSVHRHG